MCEGWQVPGTTAVAIRIRLSLSGFDWSMGNIGILRYEFEGRRDWASFHHGGLDREAERKNEKIMYFPCREGPYYMGRVKAFGDILAAWVLT